MATPSFAEVMKEALEHANSLYNERKNRPLGRHLDDQRIATEIAAHQFNLGKCERICFESNQNCEIIIQRNLDTIKEIRSIYALLQAEMDIATNRDLVND